MFVSRLWFVPSPLYKATTTKINNLITKSISEKNLNFFPISFAISTRLKCFTLRTLWRLSPSYPGPHRRHRAKSLPVPRGMMPTHGATLHCTLSEGDTEGGEGVWDLEEGEGMRWGRGRGWKRELFEGGRLGRDCGEEEEEVYLEREWGRVLREGRWAGRECVGRGGSGRGFLRDGVVLSLIKVIFECAGILNAIELETCDD